MYWVARDANEKIEQETLLRQSEQRFKALVQEGADMISIIDVAGNYIYTSPTTTAILGITPEEFDGNSVFDFIHPDDKERAAGYMQRISTESKVIVEPFRLRNGNNEWRWIETVLTNMLSNPAIKGIVANSRDITENVNMFKDIVANELFNKTVIESSPDCLKILDNEGRLLYINYNGLYHMEIDDFSLYKNKEWWILWGAENKGLVKESVEKALKGEIVNFSALGPTAKGTPKWWDVTLSPVSESGGPIQKIISVSRDVTAQKEEEQRLKLLESVITNTHDAILITDAEPFDEPGPRIIYVNEAFTRMTGYTPEEVIGKTPRILQGPDSNQEDLREFGRKLRRWEAAEVTVLNYTKTGEPFWVNLAVSPVADQYGWFTHWVSIEREVTEQKIKEREKELLTDISLKFNRENDYINACIGLCQTIGVFGQFDWVELWTVNIERSKVLYTGHYLHNPSDEFFYKETKGYDSFEIGSGLPGYVWQKKEQVLWNTQDDTKDFTRKETAKKINLNTVLGIPLTNQNEVIGVLLVGSKQKAEYLEKYAGLFANFHNFIGSEINRKKMENDLNHLYESIPDIVCVADFQGRFLKMNPSGCHLLGYTEDELLYHSFDEFVYPADKDISAQEVAKLGKGQSVFSFENRYVQKNGEICWLSWTCNANLQEGIIYATARNITGEKKLLELNNIASKMARIGSWEADLQKNKLFWTEMVHQLHETDPQNFEPDFANGINFYREDFRNIATEAIKQCTQFGTPFDFEAMIVTANKNELWVRVIGAAEFVNGECIRFYGSFQDINERKEADLRLQSLADNLPGVVFQYIVRPDGTDALKYVSKGANEIWEYSPEEVMANIDLVWDQTRAGGDFGEVQHDIKESIKTKTKWVSRYNSFAPSGKIKTLLGTGTPNFLTDGTVLYNSLVLDITKEAQNEELLKQASNMAKIGSWELDLINQENDTMYWSPMTRVILEVDDLYNPSLTGGFEFYTEGSKQLIQQAVDALVQFGKEFDEELLIITSNGNEKWIRCIGKSERVRGKCVKIYGSFQDIHASKSLEIQIREILESISDCFYALDGELNFTYMNASCANLLGVKKERIIDKNLFTEFPHLKNTQFEDELRKVQKTAEPTKFEFYYPPFDAWFEESIYPTPTGISVYFVDITQRKNANAEIAKSEEKRRLIMNGALDAIITIDTNETITFWNSQAEVIFGWKAEEVMGKPLSEMIIPEPFRKYHVKGIKNYLQTGEGKAINVLLELSALRKNGEEFPIELTVIPIKQGGEEFFCAFIRDITQRKKTERELLNAFNENTRILERITEAFVSLDNNWCYTYMNKQAGEIFNRDPEKMKGKHIWTEFPEGLNQPFHLAYEKAMATQQYIHVEEHYKPYDLWFENHIYPSADGLSIFFRDISERKKNEEKLRQSNERFEKVTEATNDVIWDWDINSGTFFRSNAIDKIFGEGTAKVINDKQFWKDSFHPEDLVKVKQSIQRALADPECMKWEQEYRVLNQSKEIIYIIDRGLVIRDSKGKPTRMVGAMTDISERKKHEEALLELNDSLRKHAHELELTNEQLDQFAYIASHDLQEPLRMISSFMDQLKRKYEGHLDEKAHQYINFATNGAKSMKRIILDLLEYSKAGKSIEDVVDVDLNDLLSDYQLLRYKVIKEKSVQISYNSLPVISANKAPLLQTIHCLLDNAIKYAKEALPPFVQLEVEDKVNEWQFCIKDNGIGIDSQFFEKIFIIFQRLHNRDEYEGTGIGLSIAKKNVDSWGGQIWLESELGKGTSFYFTIPKQIRNITI